jgi:hypothetical protein
VGPLITPRIGQRGLSIAGFAILFVSLLIAAAALYTDHVWILPFAAAAMLWGHYWDAENVVTIPAMVARPQAGISRHGDRVRLYVRLCSSITGIPVHSLPRFVHGDRAGQRDVVHRTFSAAIFILPWLGWRRRATKLVLRNITEFLR